MEHSSSISPSEVTMTRGLAWEDPGPAFACTALQQMLRIPAIERQCSRDLFMIHLTRWVGVAVLIALLGQTLNSQGHVGLGGQGDDLFVVIDKGVPIHTFHCKSLRQWGDLHIPGVNEIDLEAHVRL